MSDIIQEQDVPTEEEIPILIDYDEDEDFFTETDEFDSDEFEES